MSKESAIKMFENKKVVSEVSAKKIIERKKLN